MTIPNFNISQSSNSHKRHLTVRDFVYQNHSREMDVKSCTLVHCFICDFRDNYIIVIYLRQINNLNYFVNYPPLNGEGICLSVINIAIKRKTEFHEIFTIGPNKEYFWTFWGRLLHASQDCFTHSSYKRAGGLRSRSTFSLFMPGTKTEWKSKIR